MNNIKPTSVKPASIRPSDLQHQEKDPKKPLKSILKRRPDHEILINKNEKLLSTSTSIEARKIKKKTPSTPHILKKQCDQIKKLDISQLCHTLQGMIQKTSNPKNKDRLQNALDRITIMKHLINESDFIHYLSIVIGTSCDEKTVIPFKTTDLKNIERQLNSKQMIDARPSLEFTLQLQSHIMPFLKTTVNLLSMNPKNTKALETSIQKTDKQFKTLQEKAIAYRIQRSKKPITLPPLNSKILENREAKNSYITLLQNIFKSGLISVECCDKLKLKTIIQNTLEELSQLQEGKIKHPQDQKRIWEKSTALAVLITSNRNTADIQNYILKQPVLAPSPALASTSTLSLSFLKKIHLKWTHFSLKKLLAKYRKTSKIPRTKKRKVQTAQPVNLLKSIGSNSNQIQNTGFFDDKKRQ
ncbi:MAG: hypothetical protein HAW62_03160 [Endozoicomonadaceae bacterium]|nr:hypothetical protein [Endozoicomonadaceae bacterium]